MENEWITNALTEKIERVRFDPLVWDQTRRIAGESWGDNRPEQGGYLRGILRDGTYYVDCFSLQGMGRDGEVCFNLPPKREETLEIRLRQKVQGYGTVIAHSHPRITKNLLNKVFPEEDVDDVLTYLDLEMMSGKYQAYLRSKGRETTHEEVLNELFGKNLSEFDIENTPGRYSLLISPTVGKLAPF